MHSELGKEEPQIKERPLSKREKRQLELYEKKWELIQKVFFARENSPFLQRFFPRHRWGIFLLT
jgi:hypothetical protein